MNSLVGYGVSSESDSDGDVEDVNNGGVGSVKQEADEAPAVKRSRNFLLEPGSASSESDSEDDPEEEDPESSSSPPILHPRALAPSAAHKSTLGSLTSNKLPPPSLYNTCSDNSVFANPFKAQADQKLSALQKHVPLTMQAKPSQIGGKRMCVSYRKDGRCRFGIKCKFAHDSDLQTTATSSADSHPAVSEETPELDQAESHAGGSCGGGSGNLQQETKEEESGGQQGKKRRVGLSNTLIPPKRAMKQYAMHRDRERINMS